MLVLSAYDAQSHRRWHQGLVDNLPFDFTVMALPARYFNWRIRGNPLTWALGSRSELVSEKWDLIIATSMVDLATLKGLLPELSSVPCVSYFHENQFSYPQQSSLAGNQTSAIQTVEPQMVTLYGALAANTVIFNSLYNQRTFFTGVECLLRKLPDAIPKGVVEGLAQKSIVLPVPVDDIYFQLAISKTLPLPESIVEIVWNHRWEYDKGPDRLFAMINKLSNEAPDLNIRWHIVGQQFRQNPKIFEQIKSILVKRGWLGHWGFLGTEQYYDVLRESHIVFSTALHDFQGLAVMDAVAAGCIPLLPDRLAYAEFFSSEYLYFSEATQSNFEAETESAVLKFLQILKEKSISVPSLDHLSWHRLSAKYMNVFDSVKAP